MSNKFNNKIIEKHFWLSQRINWLIRGHYHKTQSDDKKTPLNPRLYKTFGFSPASQHTITMWELYNRSGYYDLLLEVGLLGLSRNIESFFKEYLTSSISKDVLLKPKYKGKVFQRIKDVINILKEGVGKDFSLDDDFVLIGKCMEVRHIYQHNDGEVDQKFKDKVATSFKVGDIYQLSDKEISEFSQSYENILRKLDN